MDGSSEADRSMAAGSDATAAIRFHGEHQPGIDLPPQRYAFFVAFDLETAAPAGDELTTARIADNFRTLMKRWTTVAERLMAGRSPEPVPDSPDGVPADSGVADDLATHRLTFTFGLGPDLFERIGRPGRRPRELRTLPAFSTDRLDPALGGGDLLVQLCCDDPQVLSHAFRAIRARAPGLARLRWTQHGFVGDFGNGTVRNLFGQKDGTANPRPGSDEFERAVWVGGGEPDWFRGGSYLVFRKIRMDLPTWDTSTLERQERTIGRRRDSGAPLSGGSEFTAPDFERTGADGRPMIPADSHVALVRDIPMLRRSYNYDYGFVRVGTSREPGAEVDGAGVHGASVDVAPSRVVHARAASGLVRDVGDGVDAGAGGAGGAGDGTVRPVDHGRPGESDDDGHEHEHGGVPHSESGHDSFDSGLLFCAYLRDPGEFVRAQRVLAESDRLNAFVRHTGSALFAVPPGIRPGGFVAQGMLDGDQE